MRFISCLAVLSICFLTPVALGEGQLQVLAIGQVLPGESPIPLWLDADPLTDYVLIPTDSDSVGGFNMAESHRYVRIYFPRSRESLVERFDFFVFPDGNLDPFTPSNVADIRYAIEKGLGSLVTMGGDLSSTSGSAFPSWERSVLPEIMPIELNTGMQQDRSVFSIRVVKDDPPVVSMFVPLGIERVRGSTAFTYLTTRAGATLWSRLEIVGLPQRGTTLGIGKQTDWLVSWRVGPSGGIFWVVADDLDSSWWSPIYFRVDFENEYADDLFLNILLYSAGAPLPGDVSQLNTLRALYSTYNVERLLLISLLDFAESYGANTRDVYARMEEVDGLRLRSFEEYRGYAFTDATESMRSAMSMFAALGDDAMNLKDVALLWVYLTEWVAVTGTSLACGFVLWTLMVRRTLYRQVVTTRLG
jgi:hypothetical protein